MTAIRIDTRTVVALTAPTATRDVAASTTFTRDSEQDVRAVPGDSVGTGIRVMPVNCQCLRPTCRARYYSSGIGDAGEYYVTAGPASLSPFPYDLTDHTASQAG